MTEGVYIPDGDLLQPQPTASGPWFPGVQHGGAIAGLFARAIEATPSVQPMMLTRLTVDMSRRVPLGPTRVDAEVVRAGKRIQAVECRLQVAGEIVGRATATLVRVAEDVVGDEVARPPWPEDGPLGDPGEVAEMTARFGPADFVDNFTMRRHEPEPGRSVSWLRMNVPLVAGEVTSPVVFAAAVADMIPSAGSVVDFDSYLSVNPDLSMHIHRVPAGDWIGHEALVRVSPHGWGQTDAKLFDQHGAIGRSLKSLLIDPR